LREPDAAKRAALLKEAEQAMKKALRIAAEEGDSDQGTRFQKHYITLADSGKASE